jgi:hydrogenase maturation protein HypF
VITSVRTPTEVKIRRRFTVRGVVQGVGFRPFAYTHATALGLIGSVRNGSEGVVIEVEGPPAEIARFAALLRSDPPPLAVLETIETVELDLVGEPGFSIVSSEANAGRTLVSPDIATCTDCLRELADPSDRRYRHPFITCTNCGPRYTIITGLPYDRASTTMGSFAMCALCRAEYENPTNRRFHAQPIACPDCGPRLSLVVSGQAPVSGGAALERARGMLFDGAILAVKGIGGYHLVCDARNDAAVVTLRRRKGRADKPFAVMVRDFEVLGELADVNELERLLIAGVRHPIVLLQKRSDAALSAAVAPGNPDLGVLLPYSPLHTLLFGLPGDPDRLAALVMTSANLSGEPIVFDDDDALLRLAGLVDGWLGHDRRIHVPVDDSVTRVVDGQELPIRRSRGYAPLPMRLPFDVPATLAVGADLKNVSCVGAGRHAWLSQHLGDMDDLRTFEALGTTSAGLLKLTGIQPIQLAADQHPSYRSSEWARRSCGDRPVQRIQHHHAHVASLMAEHGLDGSVPIIGFAFDGNGFGLDGAIWGGEVLLADYGSFERVSHLSYVPLPGGDASVRRPYRMALAHLAAAGIPWADNLPCVVACPPEERTILRHQIDSGLGCVSTSSMGRLFDAVSSLAGVRHIAGYEAQAAIELEGLSRGCKGEDAYVFEIDEAGIVDVSSLIRAVVADVTAGVKPGLIGARFHIAVATVIRDLAVLVRARSERDIVGLTGGVFANPTLLTLATQMLRYEGFTVLRHRLVPPNDGGIALGQLCVAAASSCA